MSFYSGSYSDSKAIDAVKEAASSTAGSAGALIKTDSDGRLSAKFLRQYNDIGIPGQQGFGVGICPDENLPTGMVAQAGTEIIGHDDYGNYQYTDGSIMCYVPAFYYKYGSGDNGLPVNVPDIKPYWFFADETEANAAGYVLDRMFKDGDGAGGTVIHAGVFADKFMCSKHALGTGFVASSVAGGNPISTHADHNPIADLTACDSNNYYQCITAAHARDGEDGAVNASSRFFCISRFIHSGLALLALAHGQAATATTWCTWYDPDGVTNFPKGCNDNSLGDTNDPDISYTTDGYSNCGQTGSGTPFARTTHNGQACGVADLNGLMYEVAIGLTCIASDQTIEDISRANPANVQITGHGYSTGDQLMLRGIATGDWAGLDDKIYQATVVDADNFTLDGVDSSGFTAAYVQGTNGGAMTSGTFHAAKETIRMADFTAGNSEATDHWGATGVAAMMEEVNLKFKTDYPNNGLAQRFGNSENQVLSEASTGNEATLTALGLPKDSDGVSSTGADLFGDDYFYQYIRNELCALSCNTWCNGSLSGPWALSLSYGRAYSTSYVGFRAACFPDQQ